MNEFVSVLLQFVEVCASVALVLLIFGIIQAMRSEEFKNSIQDLFKMEEGETGELMDEALEKMGLKKDVDPELSEKRRQAQLKGVAAKQQKKVEDALQQMQQQLVNNQYPVLLPLLSRLPIVGPIVEETPALVPVVMNVGRPLIEPFLEQVKQKVPYRLRGSLDKILEQDWLKILQPENIDVSSVLTDDVIDSAATEAEKMVKILMGESVEE